jgi:hypothetical protein
MSDLDDFERLVAALNPWLGSVVFVGGWAHRLHREHPSASIPAYAPVRTRDADVAFGTSTPLKGKIAPALRRAGFREELSSDEKPPIAKYHLGNDDQGFYAEFLTPLTGSGTKRDGSSDATLARGGVVAQRLRHLEVLLVAPWQLRIGGIDSPFVKDPADILVTNPTAFVVQKLLIHGLRKPGKQAQDILYIHDTIELFGSSLDNLAELWRETVRPALSASQRHQVRARRHAIFSTTSDTIREAARIPVDRRLRPEELRLVCEHGLDTILAKGNS